MSFSLFRGDSFSLLNESGGISIRLVQRGWGTQERKLDYSSQAMENIHNEGSRCLRMWPQRVQQGGSSTRSGIP